VRYPSAHRHRGWIAPRDPPPSSFAGWRRAAPSVKVTFPKLMFPTTRNRKLGKPGASASAGD